MTGIPPACLSSVKYIIKIPKQVHNRKTIFASHYLNQPGFHYHLALQDLAVLNIHAWLPTNRMWDLVKVFLSGKCSVSAQQLVKRPLNFCISSLQALLEGA